MEKKVLSVVIPTLNRLDLLRLSVQGLLPQIEVLRQQVEFVILNNASDDGTAEWLDQTFTNHPVVRYVNFSNRVEIAESIARCAEHATGEFLWVFGDDDYAMPFAIRTILEQLTAAPTCGLLYFNCLRGDRHMAQYVNLFETAIGLQPEYFTLEALLARFNVMHLGMITALVFRRSNWSNGHWFYRDTHYGYNFLGPILAGNANQPCLYFSFPVVICRLGAQRYVRQWPLYTLAGIPNIIADLEQAKLIGPAPLAAWADRQTLIDLVKASVLAKAYDYPARHPYWENATRYFRGTRRLAMHCVRYGLPGWLGRFVFNQLADKNTPRA